MTPISLLLRIFSGHHLGIRYVAASCFIAGALIARYAWIAAGRVSSRDPQALFQIQHSLNGEHYLHSPDVALAHTRAPVGGASLRHPENVRSIKKKGELS
jgi:hypothetical protein